MNSAGPPAKVLPIPSRLVHSDLGFNIGSLPETTKPGWWSDIGHRLTMMLASGSASLLLMKSYFLLRVTYIGHFATCGEMSDRGWSWQ